MNPAKQKLAARLIIAGNDGAYMMAAARMDAKALRVIKLS